jgi:hypothetical protein
MAAAIGCDAAVFTAVSNDEMATVLSVTAPGIDRDGNLANRIPMVPPIGDSFVFAQSGQEQDRWIGKLRGATDDVVEIHRERLRFVRDNGYLCSFLPSEGNAAYREMRDATKQYENGRLTPSEERQIRASIGNTPIDYRVRELNDSEHYDVGSIVLPVRDPSGVYSLTLRLGSLPLGASGATVKEWLARARSVVAALENN